MGIMNFREIPLTALPHNSYRPHFVPVRDKRDGEKTLCWKLLQIISLTDCRRGRGGHSDKVFLCGHDYMVYNNAFKHFEQLRLTNSTLLAFDVTTVLNI